MFAWQLRLFEWISSEKPPGVGAPPEGVQAAVVREQAAFEWLGEPPPFDPEKTDNPPLAHEYLAKYGQPVRKSSFWFFPAASQFWWGVCSSETMPWTVLPCMAWLGRKPVACGTPLIPGTCDLVPPYVAAVEGSSTDVPCLPEQQRDPTTGGCGPAPVPQPIRPSSSGAGAAIVTTLVGTVIGAIAGGGKGAAAGAAAGMAFGLLISPKKVTTSTPPPTCDDTKVRDWTYWQQINSYLLVDTATDAAKAPPPSKPTIGTAAPEVIVTKNCEAYSWDGVAWRPDVARTESLRGFQK